MIRFFSLTLFCALLAGCASSQKAPVIDRMPASKPAAKDWRPDIYTVKRGDTLYSIGLDHGYDYKEVAEANNIRPPYTIYVGQKLKLKPKTTMATAPAVTPAKESPDVIITPLGSGSSGVESNTIAGSESSTIVTSETSSSVTSSQIAPATAPMISEPRALREAYSEQALNAPIVQAKTAAVLEPASAPAINTATKPAATEATAAGIFKPTTTATIAGITWSWPTNGKLLAGFNDAGSAKGIDIGGSTGQSIVAAAPGKVIYSGSDLRGYGKLVIVKHNADFLSVYAHNSKILVKEGDQVTRGQQIAEMGNTDTDKTKLHFEIRRQGKSVDPAEYLPANPG